MCVCVSPDLGDYDKNYDYAQSDQRTSPDELPANDMSAQDAVQRSPLWPSHYYHADPRQPVDIDSYDDVDVKADAPSFNVSFVVEPARQGTLRVRVTWTLPEDDVTPQISSGEDDVASCTVNWARYTCNVDRAYPHCDVINDHFDAIMTVRRGQVRAIILLNPSSHITHRPVVRVSKRGVRACAINRRFLR